VGGMSSSNSAASERIILFSEDDNMKAENCCKLSFDDEEEKVAEEVDYTKLLGKVIKEGTIHVHDIYDKWVQCYVVIREQGITLSLQSKRKNNKKENEVDAVMDFSSLQEVDVVMLPDNARRSRESKLFPFTVQTKTNAVFRHPGSLNIKNNIARGILQGRNKDEVILATSNGREMWEWASCVRWLGTTPKEENIPLFAEPVGVADHNMHYENSEVLQDAILKMFTYKNLPTNPVSFEDIARIDKARHRIFYQITYPSGFLSQEVIRSEPEDQIHITENHAHTFGLFAYIVLMGACIHVNEKCFELITSSDLYDISSQVNWKGNSPLSMLCEGKYKSSRKFMVEALFRLGYPNLDGSQYPSIPNYSTLISKPYHISLGIRSAAGGPVHPDDQKLCWYLQDNGDGKEDNIELSKQLIEASRNSLIEFTHHNSRATAISIPQSIMNWGCTLLTKLNLSRNSIIEIPEELFGFTTLTHLDVSMNSLFGLSHKLGNLTNLQYFDIRSNLVEELPYTLEKLEKLTDFKCYKNPITTPPSAVWSRGIVPVREFFKDMRESGTEINLDLRVLVLGLSEAGKTSLINGMVNPNDIALTRVGDRTVGIEKRTWSMERSTTEHDVNLLTYDFAGQEEYYITHHLFLGSKALYIIAFDLSKYKPMLLNEQIIAWWDSIQNRVCDVKSNDSKTPKVLLVGTHADMVDDAQGTVNEIHKSLIGHFDCRMKGIKDNIENLEKELRNIDPRKVSKSHDDVDINTNSGDPIKGRKVYDKATAKKGDEEYALLSTEKKIQILTIKSEVKKLYHQKQCTISLPTEIQAVSSKDLLHFDKLKEQISSSLAEIGPSGKYFPHLDVHVPHSWCKVQRLVRQQGTMKGCECMHIPKYFKLLSDELNINEDVGRRATQFCHDLGDVLFFEREDLIFLQPSFLIDIFKYVIRHDHKESTFWTEKMLDHNISQEKFNAGKESLLQRGELEQWLLELLWSPLFDNLTRPSMMNNMIQLLETFDIATFIELKGRKFLSIPEFQPKTLVKNWCKHADDGEYQIQRWISVDQKLPHGLLKRIQVRIFKKVFKRSGTKHFNLAQNEFYILDTKCAELYCLSGKSTEECPGFGIAEGIRMYIRGTDKQHVVNLLSKVYACVQDTLNEYPGLMFNQYVVHTSKKGSSFNKLHEVQAMQAAGKSTIPVSIILKDTDQVKYKEHEPNTYQHRSLLARVEEATLNISDLLPSPPKFEL